jgi:hypothetical protein
MSAWQIFRPHRWIRRSDTVKSVRFKEVFAAIQSALQNERSARRRNVRPRSSEFALNASDKTTSGAVQAPDT